VSISVPFFDRRRKLFVNNELTICHCQQFVQFFDVAFPVHKDLLSAQLRGSIAYVES
jgi:hypothetical protein